MLVSKNLGTLFGVFEGVQMRPCTYNPFLAEHLPSREVWLVPVVQPPLEEPTPCSSHCGGRFAADWWLNQCVPHSSEQLGSSIYRCVVHDPAAFNEPPSTSKVSWLEGWPNFRIGGTLGSVWNIGVALQGSRGWLPLSGSVVPLQRSANRVTYYIDLCMHFATWQPTNHCALTVYNCNPCCSVW